MNCKSLVCELQKLVCELQKFSLRVAKASLRIAKFIPIGKNPTDEFCRDAIYRVSYSECVATIF